MFSIGGLCTWAFPGFEYSKGRRLTVWVHSDCTHCLYLHSGVNSAHSQGLLSLLFMTSMTLVPSCGPYMKIISFRNMWKVRCLAFYIFKQVTTKAKELKDSITCSPGEFPPYHSYSCIQATERLSHFLPKWVSIYLITNLTQFLRN